MPEVVMPRLSDTMEEGTLSQWIKHPGDEVRRGDIMAVIETDKAAMDLEAYEDGVLTDLLVEEGASVPIGTPIAIIDGQAAGAPPATPAAPTETAGPAETAAPTGTAAPTETAAPQAPAPSAPSAPQPETAAPPRRAAPSAPTAAQPPPAPPAGEPGRPSGQGRVPTSPLARALAQRHGIDLAGLTGSGPGGRIVRADVEDAVRRLAGAQPAVPPGPARGAPARTPAPPAPAPPGPAVAGQTAEPGLAPLPPGAAPPARPRTAPPGPASGVPGVPQAAPGRAVPSADGAGADVEELPLTRVRRITAERMVASATGAPHFYLTRVMDAGPLLEFRAGLNTRPGAQIKFSVTDLLVKACATVLARHPEVNSSWTDQAIRRYRRVHIGMAVAIEDGLIVPVIRDADRKSLTEIASEAHDLADRARSRRLAPDEITGSTFSISNLGMYGIDQFTAVINPPEAAILAVGAITRQPVVQGEEIVIGTTMALTLSIDHRVVDGATGAVFLDDLVKLLEDPISVVI